MQPENSVPYSECAMAMRIAGKALLAIRRRSTELVEVWIEGQDYCTDTPYRGLICELIPFELRPSLLERGLLVLEEPPCS